MIRSAYFTESASCEPPKPRLMTLRSGKASVDFHIRMLELPTKTISFSGGGLVLSLASKAAMSFAKGSALSWTEASKATTSPRIVRIRGSLLCLYYVGAGFRVVLLDRSAPRADDG